MIIKIPRAFETLSAQSWAILHSLSRDAGLAPLAYLSNLLDQKFCESIDTSPDIWMTKYACVQPQVKA